MLAQGPAHFHPVHLGHHQIQNDHRGKIVLGHRQPLGPVGRLQHIEAGGPEIRPEEHPDIRFVVHHQDAFTHGFHGYLAQFWRGNARKVTFV